jgi:nucleotide-binding universal stress UspA family protein
MVSMEKLAWNRILATTDFSPFAQRAVSYAHRLAEEHGAELHVLHVVASISAMVGEHGTSGTLDPKDEDDGSKWLAELLGEAGGIRRVEAVRVGQDVPQTIVQYAKNHAIDLIIMATHGRTGLAHAVLGSNAEKVLRAATCPVLVIPRLF